MLNIPLRAKPAQITSVILGGQNCRIKLYQKTEGLFVDLVANGTAVVTCVVGRDGALIVCRGYIGFVGNLMFVDTQGSSDPEYSGLGTRYKLLYMSEAEADVILQ